MSGAAFRRLGTAALSAAALGLTPGPALGQGTLTLEEALGTALRRNPQIERADAAVAAAAAGRWADWGALLPSAAVSANWTRNDFTTSTFLNPEGTPQRLPEPLEDVSKSVSQSLSLSLDLLNVRNLAGLRSGAKRSAAADLRLTAAERGVVRDVKAAYFEALKQQRLVDVAERQLEARRQDYDLTERRYRIAAASRSDLLGAEIDLSDAELRLLEARDALETAVRGLQVAIAGDPGQAEAGRYSLEDVGELPDATLLDEEELVRLALERNPTLRALEQEEEAASTELWAARSDYLPTVSASFGLGRSEQLGEDASLFVFDPENTSQTFSIRASWNLFDGFSRRRQTASAGRTLRQTRADRTLEELRIEKDVRDRVAELQRRARKLDILERNVELARERLQLAREQYRLGSIPYFNLQQAIDRLTQAEQAAFRERYDYLIGWAELEERVGVDVR